MNAEGVLIECVFVYTDEEITWESFIVKMTTHSNRWFLKQAKIGGAVKVKSGMLINSYCYMPT